MLYDEMMALALQLGSSSFSDLPDEHTLYVDGAASLLGGEYGLALDTMHALLEMIEEKQRLVGLLNEYIDGTGLTVVIGAEHLEPSLRPFSLVACVQGRRRLGHGWRHRPNAHALLTRDCGGRRRRAEITRVLREPDSTGHV